MNARNNHNIAHQLQAFADEAHRQYLDKVRRRAIYRLSFALIIVMFMIFERIV